MGEEGGPTEEDILREYEALTSGCDFTVRYDDGAGKFLAAKEALKAETELLIETPLAAWPLTAQNENVEDDSWCERCLCPVSIHRISMSVGKAVKRRRLRQKCHPLEWRKAGHCPLNRCTDHPRLCAVCAADAGSVDFSGFFCNGQLRRWREWQASRSVKSAVGIEAIGRCLAHIGRIAVEARKAGLSADEALQFARRPFLRLVAPPDGSLILDGTSVAEVCAELRASQPFARELERMAGGEAAVAELLSVPAIGHLAGQLVLNTTSLEFEGKNENPLMAAGCFTIHSMLNHSCTPNIGLRTGLGHEIHLWTSRDVEAGEPLTISYVPVEWELKDRRERLQHWFFTCTCTRCEAEDHILQALGQQA